MCVLFGMNEYQPSASACCDTLEIGAMSSFINSKNTRHDCNDA